jgi:filamentous hemagglutinin family protein
MKKLVVLVTKTSLWIISSIFISIPVLAQEAPITADGTTSTTVTTPDGSNFDIKDGDKVGGNLFHSFGNFSVPNGGSANFLNSADIQNIISRVTGGNISNIEGLIKANGSANLFLINPAGIIFGSNASLSIGGSFLGSTANSLKFPEGEFIATNKEGKPLLTIKAPIGLGIRDNPGNIVNNAGLQVNPGKNITIVGGNINLDGGKLIAPGGRVELGSLNRAGTVGLNDSSLSFPNGISRGDLTLDNGALIDARAGGGGAIAVNANNVNLLGQSQLLAGIAENQGTPFAKAGDITINATGSVSVKDAAKISNNIFGEGNGGVVRINANDRIEVDGSKDGAYSTIESALNGRGKAGTVELNAKNLSVTNLGQINSGSTGEGDAGIVKINAIDTILVDGNQDGAITSISSSVDKKGNAGTIDIATKNLSLSNLAQISTSNQGEGNAGKIAINSSDTIKVDGSKDGAITSISSAVDTKGNAGTIDIATNNLSLTNGSQITTDLYGGEGNAGIIKINASDNISVSGDENSSAIGITSVVRDGKGKSGTVDINTKNLSVDKVAQISTNNNGQGDAGTIIIKASDRTSIDGNNNKIGNYSGISSIGNGGEQLSGNSGTINITTKDLSLSNGGQIGTSNYKQGDGGSSKINVSNNISVDGRVSDSLEDGTARSVPTSISSGIGAGIKGNAGTIDITTKNLSVTNGAQVGAVIQGEGNGGSLKISASDSIRVDGRVDGLSRTGEKQSFPSSIATEIEQNGKGNGGNVEITAKNLSLTNGAKISSSSDVTEGQTGGNIILNVKDILSLRGGSFISAKATGNGSGGNIRINAKDGFVVASPENNNDIIATAQAGKDGNININARAIYGFDESRLQANLSPEERDNLLNNKTNDINSTSNNSPSNDRTLNINTQNLDTGERFSENLIEPQQVTSQACSASATTAEGVNSFTIIGRGGMPDDPTKPLNSIAIAGDLGAEEQGKQTEAMNLASKNKTFSSDEIRPARGMTVNEKGQVVLTAYPTPNASDRSLTQADYCFTKSLGDRG